MPSKAETRAAIAALASELGVTTPDLEAIDRLEPLEALLVELQAQKAASAASAPPIQPVATPAALADLSYEVAPGKTLTTLRGKRFGGAPVTARDFPGGESTLKSWVEKGFVVASSDAK